MGPEVKALYTEVLHAPWRTAAIYLAAGAWYALTMAVGFLAATEHKLASLRILLLFWVFAWPMVLTVNLVVAATRRTKLVTVIVYFVILAAVFEVVRSPHARWSQLPLVCLINLLPTILLLTFLNRRIRAVGPLVLIFMLFAVMGLLLALLSFLQAFMNEQLLFSILKGATMGPGLRVGFLGLAALSFLVPWPAGWLTLCWIRKRYEQKKITDQTITVDAIWLLFAAYYSFVLLSYGTRWMFASLVAFLGYKAVTWTGFSLLRRAASPPSRRNFRLLLLRVFSLGKRSEELFAALAAHWRNVGSIELIAGPDLATDTVEPHQFLDFLSGKLARRFIDGPETLDLRISEMDTKPDPDGRFRVNDFFSHDDLWKRLLSRLVNESDAVLMDLRGFSTQSDGCAFEIEELVSIVEVARVVFVIDDTTDEQFLLRKVRESWDQMRPTSPNRQSTCGQLHLVRFTGSRGADLQQLLYSLCRVVYSKGAFEKGPQNKTRTN